VEPIHKLTEEEKELFELIHPYSKSCYIANILVAHAHEKINRSKVIMTQLSNGEESLYDAIIQPKENIVKKAGENLQKIIYDYYKNKNQEINTTVIMQIKNASIYSDNLIYKEMEELRQKLESEAIEEAKYDEKSKHKCPECGTRHAREAYLSNLPGKTYECKLCGYGY
jgi:predicted RNA-binding Zn-ribbon protein involved in translation (DUF1610 family)